MCEKKTFVQNQYRATRINQWWNCQCAVLFDIKTTSSAKHHITFMTLIQTVQVLQISIISPELLYENNFKGIPNPQVVLDTRLCTFMPCLDIQ